MLPHDLPSKRSESFRKGINKIQNVWKKFCHFIPDLFTRQMMVRLFFGGSVRHIPHPSVASVSDSISSFDYLLSLVRNVNDTVANFIQESKAIHHIFCFTKLFSGLYLPFSSYYMVKTGKKIGQGGPREVLIDRSLRMITWAASIGESIANPIIGAVEMGWLPGQAFMWAQPLLGVSAFFSLLNGLVHGRRLWQTERMIRDVHNATGKPPKKQEREAKNVRETIEYYRSHLNDAMKKRRFGKILGIKKEGMAKIEKYIHATGEKLRAEPDHPEHLTKGREILHVLDTRCRNQRIGHSLAITAGVCMLVALCILVLAATGPLGSALLAVGISIGIAALITQKVLDHRFEKKWKRWDSHR